MSIDETSEAYVRNLRGHATMWYEQYHEDIKSLLGKFHIARSAATNGVV